MRLRFAGFGEGICLDPGKVTTLEVHNRVLFNRICVSLFSEEGRYAVEPYSFWKEDTELNPKGQLLFVLSPLELPWDEREFNQAIMQTIEELFFEDESSRIHLEELARSLETEVARMALQMNSDYDFSLNWDLKRYLRSFGFGVEMIPGDTSFDKLIKFLHLAADAKLKRTLAFMNLKLFFSENQMEEIIEQMVFSGLSVLLLENVPDSIKRSNELKYIVDLDFLESWPQPNQLRQSLRSREFVPSVLAQ